MAINRLARVQFEEQFLRGERQGVVVERRKFEVEGAAEDFRGGFATIGVGQVVEGVEKFTD